VKRQPPFPSTSLHAVIETVQQLYTPLIKPATGFQSAGLFGIVHMEPIQRKSNTKPFVISIALRKVLQSRAGAIFSETDSNSLLVGRMRYSKESQQWLR
jgi:hypothetical protein